jgi:hypothetical protein
MHLLQTIEGGLGYMAFGHHNRGKISYSELSAQSSGLKITASFSRMGKMHGRKFVQMTAILILSVLLTPPAGFSYTILWDTSHGIANSGQYQPGGYYLALTEYLGDNGFTTVTTNQGFLVDDPAGYDVLVVCLTSAFDSSYTTAEVERIVDFVDEGGGLLIMGDRQAAPNAHIAPVASRFGITFGSDVISSYPNFYDVYTSELELSHSVFGSFTTNDEIFMYAASELSVTSPAFSIAQQEGTGKTIAAAAQYGQGRVVALGDCSLWTLSDSVLNPWDYFHEADNPQFALNTFNYLAVPEPATLLLLGLGAVLLRKRG